nr:MAG TPA: hypothetical protein [Caudoviricetes sp.]DAN06825.1 MAG TPA: hypothetical protein [Caudoviricetes sp.]
MAGGKTRATATPFEMQKPTGSVVSDRAAC